MQRRIDSLYRSESRRVLATLIRLLGDFDLAEEALHDAFAAAIERWPTEGEPANPRAWLVSTGRFKAIDRVRRRRVFDARLPDIIRETAQVTLPDDVDPEGVADDRLRMIFTCCHPALALEAQIPLTLRTVCGLTTEEIAHAYLIPAPTLAQRIVRAKAKIRDAHIPYEVPSGPELMERLDAVLHVIYLVFNEGYSASLGGSVTRADMAAEAIRLGRLLLDLLPDAEVRGLLGLMLLHDSRRAARMRDGALVLLEDQNRALWDRKQIREGAAHVREALSSGRIGAYTLQGAIAAVHAESVDGGATDWRQIAGLYDVLYRVLSTPVVALNRAVAVAMAFGAERGLAMIDTLLARGELGSYQHAHSARADLLRRLARTEEAREAYQRALDLTTQEPERQYLQRRIDALA